MLACDNLGNYNTQACGWDFGHCCKATCENFMWYKPYSCGALGYILVSEAPAPRQQLQLVRNQRSSYSWGFGSLSRNYTSSISDTLFGQPVYYDSNNKFMLYLCQEELSWIIQRKVNITQIMTYGCLRQGPSSSKLDNPANICNATLNVREEYQFILLWDNNSHTHFSQSWA